MTKVLVIDDDTDVQGFIRDCLQVSGYAVDLAENGDVGIRCVKREEYEVVTCDIHMPEKEGIETIQELQQRDPSPAIIACSGGVYRGLDFLPLAKRMGAIDVLYKPFTPAQLRAAIDNVLVEQGSKPNLDSGATSKAS